MLQALDTGLIDAVQVVYNVLDQNPEDELFPACQAQNIAVIARVPFDEGSLTGTLTADTRWPDGRLPQQLLHARRTWPRRCRASTRSSRSFPPGMTLPELALRHILQHPAVSTVIPGMRKTSHVEQNLAASDAGPLPAGADGRAEAAPLGPDGRLGIAANTLYPAEFCVY